MNRKAFTLIELLVVVAIIGILAAVGVVAYNGYTVAAKEKVTESNFNNINKALVLEFMNCELDSSKLIFSLKILNMKDINSGGRTEIRTQERVAPLPVFKTGAFNHSAILP